MAELTLTQLSQSEAAPQARGNTPAFDKAKNQQSAQLKNNDEITTAWNTDAVLSGEETEVDLAAMRPLPGFEWENRTFPEADVLELPVQQRGNTIYLKSYRYPVSVDTPKKGVVFCLHGYGSWSEAMIGCYKFFAEAGYEVIASDMRGQGSSEGERGIIDNNDVIYDDVWLLIFESLKNFEINP